MEKVSSAISSRNLGKLIASAKKVNDDPASAKGVLSKVKGLAKTYINELDAADIHAAKFLSFPVPLESDFKKNKK